MKSSTYTIEIKQLIEKIPNHSALNNDFYDIWLNEVLPIEKIAFFLRNYWEFTYRFPEALAELLLTVDDVYIRAEYTKTLYSEMGSGNSRKAHSKLFEIFSEHLMRGLNKPGYSSINNLIKSVPLLEETQAFINKEKELYSSASQIAVGAQLALEWQAYTMVAQLYDGARNYMSYWPTKDSFHESCEFFYVHIGEAEKDHKDESIHAATYVVENMGGIDMLKEGFNEHLNFISKFWQGIAARLR